MKAITKPLLMLLNGIKRIPGKIGQSWRRTGRFWWRDVEWWVVLGIAITVLILGSYGFYRYDVDSPDTGLAEDQVSPADTVTPPPPAHRWHYVYQSLQLFVLEANMEPPIHWSLNWARFLAPLVTGYTAIRAVMSVFAAQCLLIRLRLFTNNHVVICGCGTKGSFMARDLLEKGEQVIIIERDAESDHLSECRDRGAKVIIGNATEQWLLRQLRLTKARHLFALCGDDTANAMIYLHAKTLAYPRTGKPLDCVLHVFDPDLYSSIRFLELLPFRGTQLALHLFNLYDLGARVLLESHGANKTLNMKFENDRRNCLIIVGASRLGQSVLINTARNWYQSGGAQSNMTIALFDSKATQTLDDLRAVYPGLDQSSITVPLDNPLLPGTLPSTLTKALTSRPHDSPIKIVVCLDDDARGFTAAVELATYRTSDTVVAYLWQQSSVSTLLRNSAIGYDNLHSMGLLDETCSSDKVLRGTREMLARYIHQEYCQHELGKVRLRPRLSLARFPAHGDSLVSVALSRHSGRLFWKSIETQPGGIRVDHRGSESQYSHKPNEIKELKSLLCTLLGDHKKLAAKDVRDILTALSSVDSEILVNASLVSWDELNEPLKNSNFAQADDYFYKLGLVNYKVVPIKDWREEKLVRFDKPEDIELLARKEHQRWLKDKRKQGWRYGPRKDEARRTHPCYKVWTRLPDAEKDKDRHTVRQIPNLLARVGLGLLKIPLPSPYVETATNRSQCIDFGWLPSPHRWRRQPTEVNALRVERRRPTRFT